MKRIQCPITRSDGKTHYVSAYVAAPGLAVHREGLTDTWGITHISSGRGVVPRDMYLLTKRDEARLARCLAVFFDYTADEETVLATLRPKTHIEPAVDQFKAGRDPRETADRSSDPQPGESLSEFTDRKMGVPGSVERRTGGAGPFEYWEGVWQAFQRHRFNPTATQQ